jgi:uncharacterized YccA/Bax inhibitor family protein
MRGSFGRNNFVFRRAAAYSSEYTDNVATAKGVSIKTFTLIFVTMIATLFGIFVLGPIGVMSLYLPIVIADIVLLLIMTFAPATTKWLSIPYAVLEGLMIGAIVGILEIALPGLGFSIGATAFVATMVIFLVASVLYLSGAIRVTNKLRKFMFTAIISLALASLVISIMSIFSPGIAYVFSYGPIAFLIAIIYVVIASVYVVLSLDNAYNVVDNGLAKEYEWYAAFGILINIIWLFYEILRLILIIVSRSRD